MERVIEYDLGCKRCESDVQLEDAECGDGDFNILWGSRGVSDNVREPRPKSRVRQFFHCQSSLASVFASTHRGPRTITDILCKDPLPRQKSPGIVAMILRNIARIASSHCRASFLRIAWREHRGRGHHTSYSFGQNNDNRRLQSAMDKSFINRMLP
jgi:hypothetical protein